MQHGALMEFYPSRLEPLTAGGRFAKSGVLCVHVYFCRDGVFQKHLAAVFCFAGWT